MAQRRLSLAFWKFWAGPTISNRARTPSAPARGGERERMTIPRRVDHGKEARPELWVDTPSAVALPTKGDKSRSNASASKRRG